MPSPSSPPSARSAIVNAAFDPGLERRLALAAAPRSRQPSLFALWHLDAKLGEVLATGRDPMVSRIRLAWWRDALEALDSAPPPPEPVLRACADLLLPQGVSGKDLAVMEEGWARLTEPAIDRDALETYGSRRGATLFGLSARLLGEPDPDVAATGSAWALMDLCRRSSRPDERAAAVALARGKIDRPRWPRRLRPLAILARLASRDAARFPALEREGSPGRIWRLGVLRWTGH